jgi:hypothetical protein
VSGDDETEGESTSLPVQKLFRCLEWVYDTALKGVPGRLRYPPGSAQLGRKRPIQTVLESRILLKKSSLSELAPDSRNGSITVDLQFVWLTFSTVSKNFATNS